MRSGLILLTSSVTDQGDLLREKLQAKGVAVIQCKPNDVVKIPATITDFVATNGLETVVVANFSPSPPSDAVRNALEKAKLGRLAVSWVDLVPLFAGQSLGDIVDPATITILVSIARQQRANYIGYAVSKMVPATSKVSRRELFRSIPKMFRVESDIPVVVPDRCRARADTCDYCRKACPTNAISVVGDTVAINDRLCVECGACARDCPIGAIQCPSISDVQIVEMLTELSSEKLETEKRVLMLTCPIGYRKLLEESEGGKHIGAAIVPIQIPCVASIGSVHHLWSASLGVTLLPVCPDIACSKTVALHPIHNHAMSPKNMPEILSDGRATTMRYLVLDSNDSIVDSISQAVTLTGPMNISPSLSGDSRRDLTLDGLRTLQQCNGVKMMGDGVLPIFDLKLDDARCTFCESCQIDCPDHAIEFTRNEDSTTLMFDPALCSGCMICERKCPEHAITLSRLGDFTSIFGKSKLEKAHDENAKCENCGTSLGSKRGLVALKKRLSEKGVADASLKTLNLCRQCKQSALLRGIGPQ